MAPRLELFPFRYRDPRTGKWVRAQYRAEQHEIGTRYSAWEIIGQGRLATWTQAPGPSPRTSHRSERPPELQPTIDVVEAFLLAVFLRRYVTYCARRGRYAAMNGAARLFETLPVLR